MLTSGEYDGAGTSGWVISGSSDGGDTSGSYDGWLASGSYEGGATSVWYEGGEITGAVGWSGSQDDSGESGEGGDIYESARGPERGLGGEESPVGRAGEEYDGTLVASGELQESVSWEVGEGLPKLQESNGWTMESKALDGRGAPYADWVGELYELEG